MKPRRSAGVVVVRPGGGAWRFLLLRAFRYWDFPKGGVEAGETLLQTALRETREETSLCDLVFRWGEDWIDTEPYAGGKVARYYVAECRSGEVRLEPSPTLGRPEHHEFRWLSSADAAPLLVPRVRRVLDWASARIGDDPAEPG
ncbi:MAG: NUDIX domain-containing protein [Burkholderiales bacterium]